MRLVSLKYLRDTLFMVSYTRIVYFAPTHREDPRLGVYINDLVIDLAENYKHLFREKPPEWFYDLGLFLSSKYAQKITEEILSVYSKNIRETQDLVYSAEKIIYYPLTSETQRVFCIALNYESHVRESGRPRPSRPYIFMKPRTALIGHKQSIVIPRVSEAADHEIELGVIIGRKSKYVSKRDAIDAVAGYTIFNDTSFRDWQMKSSEGLGLDWLHGKGMDNSTPVGPYLVTKDEIEDPYKLTLELRVNKEIRQRGSASEMIFSIEEIIEEISKGITLLPSDLIATGTPSGVGHAKRIYLREGDLVEAEISGIGILVNPVIRE